MCGFRLVLCFFEKFHKNLFIISLNGCINIWEELDKTCLKFLCSGNRKADEKFSDLSRERLDHRITTLYTVKTMQLLCNNVLLA